MCPVKILNRLHNAQTDLTESSLGAYVRGTFSDVAANRHCDLTRNLQSIQTDTYNKSMTEKFEQCNITALNLKGSIFLLLSEKDLIN